MKLTFFPRLRDSFGRRVTTTWPKLVARLSVPRESADKHAAPGLSLATYEGDRRALANVELVYALGLDLDEGVRWSDLRERFARCASFVHSTWSSTLTEPRARVFLPLSRPVTSSEYRLVFAAVCAKVEDAGLIVDHAASDPSRFWFLPCSRPGALLITIVGTGAPVDVDAAIAAAPPPAPPPPPVVPRPLASGGPSAFDRARAYLANVPGAVSGSGGSTATLMAAVRLVKGFSLSVDDAMVLMREWNRTCSPEWSERDLLRKVEQAATSGRMADGALLHQERGR
jgi:hypothetical protein